MKLKKLGVIPKFVLDFLKDKILKPSFDFRDIWREENQHAFTIAKSTSHNILSDVRDTLVDALEDGTTFEQFKKDITPLLQAKGWWGVQEVTDPATGKKVDAQLGSPRRLKTIYQANLRSARAAGQWERIQKTKRALPFLIYELGPSLEHRVIHEAWEGILLPVDDPFWKTHFAPNGWGCKCRIRAVTKAEYDRLVKTGKYTTKAPDIVLVDWLNKRTGEVEKIPEGIDPGWDVNPGINRVDVLKHIEKTAVDRFTKVNDS